MAERFSNSPMGRDLCGRTGHGPPAKRPVGPRHKSITMRTLGDFQRSLGYMLWASCPTCGRYRTLDLNALAQRFGRNAQVDRLKPLLRCTSCGRRGQLTVGYAVEPASPGREPRRELGLPMCGR